MPYATDGASIRPVTGVEALVDGEMLADESSTDVQLQIQIMQAKAIVTRWLDSVVMALGFDSMASCVSYSNSSNDMFRAQAMAAIAWRDAVYSRGYELIANPPQGVTPEGVLALLPQPREFGL